MKVYVLTTVSTCSCGQDIHSFVFDNKTSALNAMREQYYLDKEEIRDDVRKSKLYKNSYEVYEDGRYNENHLVGEIIATEVKG